MSVDSRLINGWHRFLSSADLLDPKIVKTTVASAILQSCFGVLFSAQWYWGERIEHHAVTLHQAIWTALVEHVPWIFFAPLVALAARSIRNAELGWKTFIPIHVLICLLFTAAHAALVLPTHSMYAADIAAPTLSAYFLVTWRALYEGFWMYCTTLVIFYGVCYHLEFRLASLREAELKAHLAQSELENLRVQLQPHFLFNTLNTIASLVGTQPAEARDMIGDLSELLRESLETRSAELVRLDEELATLDRYLSIQRMRFSDRLTIEHSIEGPARSAAVPHLLLQPLVENAIRHGISKRSRRGTIAIHAAVKGRHLMLKVADDGPGIEGREIREGVGLSNTRGRLVQLYGSDHGMEINSGAGGFAVSIRIPFSVCPEKNVRSGVGR